MNAAAPDSALLLLFWTRWTILLDDTPNPYGAVDNTSSTILTPVSASRGDRHAEQKTEFLTTERRAMALEYFMGLFLFHESHKGIFL